MIRFESCDRLRLWFIVTDNYSDVQIPLVVQSVPVLI